jgi:alcohol dehydrogenase, propanol-preferring
MKAARFYEINKPLKIEDIEVPIIGEKEVLVKVMASGICHSDLHFLDGSLSFGGKRPFILGHEPAGRVEKVGASVTRWQPGDRVVPYRFWTCGECYYCVTGNEEECLNFKSQLGFNCDGGYAEYFKWPAAFLLKMPEKLSFLEAGPLGCSGHSTYHAVTKRAKVRMGETVLVNGSGGLGLMILQFAKLAGASVFISDINDNKLTMARELGADATFNPQKQMIPDEVKKLTGNLGVDVVFDLVGAKDSLEIGVESLRRLGRMVLMGVGNNAVLNATSSRMMVNELEILGSRSSNRQELKETLELVASGRIKPIVSRTFPLEEINNAFELLRKGEIMGRACIEF